MVFDLFDQVMLDWDAEEYSKTVTRTVVKDGPPLRTKGKPAVVIPMVITDRKGIIVASETGATLMGDPTFRNHVERIRDCIEFLR